HRFTLGAPLDDVARELDIFWEHLSHYSSDIAFSMIAPLDDATSRLRGRPGAVAAGVPSPAGAGFHEVALAGAIPCHSNWVLVPTAIAAYLFGEHAEALRLAELEAGIEPYPAGIFAGAE